MKGKEQKFLSEYDIYVTISMMLVLETFMEAVITLNEGNVKLCKKQVEVLIGPPALSTWCYNSSCIHN